MSLRTLSALAIVAFILAPDFVLAQDPALEPIPPYTGKSYKLTRDGDSSAADLDLAEEEAAVWEPGIRKGRVEVSLGLGFLDLNQTLLEHDQIIYKYNTDSTFWGDVKISGESAFAPILRIGYGLNRWFSLESWYGISISEYSSSVTNRSSRKNESPPPPVQPDPPLGEFDAEARSLITLQTGLNAMIYPLAIRGDGGGRWHPFLTAGVGNMWYDMNSNYVDGSSSAFDINFGGGLRVLADEHVSLRLDVSLHSNSLEWTPADYFIELNEGTTRVPLNEYPVQPDGSVTEQPVTSFASQTMTMLQWSVGFQGSF